MFEIDRTDLIKEGIRKAYEELDARTIIDADTDSKVVFFIKNGAIWYHLEQLSTGQLWKDSRVYKIDTDKPYIRDWGRYWYLSGRELEIVHRMAVALK